MTAIHTVDAIDPPMIIDEISMPSTLRTREVDALPRTTEMREARDAAPRGGVIQYRHYRLGMDFDTQMLLLTVAAYAAWALAIIIGLLLTYLVIRQGVFHGLRAHTRWVDGGKD